MTDQNIFISNGTRPFWQKLIAALLFTGALYFLYLFIRVLILQSEIIDSNPKAVASLMQTAIILFAIGVGFSLVIHYHFDIENKRYKKIFSLGLVQFGKWTPFRNINYVAVYTNQKDEVEVNLWYDHNQHFTITQFFDSSDAIEAAKSIANKFNVDVWNALDPKNGDWLEQ